MSASFSSFAEDVEFDPFTSDFAQIVHKNTFVDKSLLIKTVCKKSRKAIVTAPHGFGKSTNLDMIKKFVEIQVNDSGIVIEKGNSPNYKLFRDNNLLIYQQTRFFYKHFATHPVLYADFSSVFGNTLGQILNKFKSVLRETFEQHKYLLESVELTEQEKQCFKRYCNGELAFNLTDDGNIDTGLKILSEYIYKHFGEKKVFVLIDGYSAPIDNTMFEHSVDIEEVNHILRRIFKEFRENEYVQSIFLTGTSIYSGLTTNYNNFRSYFFLRNSSFESYYGLTESEVDELLIKLQIDENMRRTVKWYFDGYVTSKDLKLFSTWSILNFLKFRRITNHQEKSAVIISLKTAIHDYHIRAKIETLCAGDLSRLEVQNNIYSSVRVALQNLCSREQSIETVYINDELYLNFMLQQGYLSLDNISSSDNIISVRAANKVILDQLRYKLMQYYANSINADLHLHLHLHQCIAIFNEISCSSEDYIFNSFITEFNAALQKLKIQFVDMNEATYQCIMFYILCKSKFYIPSGKKLDLIALQNNLGIFIAIKDGESSLEALEQVIKMVSDTSNQLERFENIPEKIYIGINVIENGHVNMRVLLNSTDLSNANYFEAQINQE